MDRTISFIPPDGEFQLMSYRITENVNLPFRVLPVVKELGRTRLEINIKVKSMFTFKLFATNVAIKIPLPKNTAVCNVSAASGKCRYEPEQQGECTWIRASAQTRLSRTASKANRSTATSTSKSVGCRVERGHSFGTS